MTYTKRNTQLQKQKKLFHKYTQRSYITQSQFVKLLHKEFHLQYSNHVITSCMAIWGSPKGKIRILTLQNFISMFNSKEGFLHTFVL